MASRIILVIQLEGGEGEADFRYGKGMWHPLKVRHMIHQGSDTVQVCAGNARVMLLLEDNKQVITLREGQLVEIPPPQDKAAGDKVGGKVQVKIEPGAPEVSVKQSPMFHTDFQVSTPRPTSRPGG